MKKRNIATFVILGIALLQMLGHATGSKTLRGIGLLSGISPYPKVFCESKGYEPFAAKFTLIGEDSDDATIEIPLTAERYSQLAGPYNRRNVYGAALAYAPRLPDDPRATSSPNSIPFSKSSIFLLYKTPASSSSHALVRPLPNISTPS